MATEAKEKDGDKEMSKEEKAFLVNAIWTALQAPQWSKDDLINFGKAIFTRVTLQKMADKTFEQVFPFLSKIADSLGVQLTEQAEKQLANLNGSGKKVEKDKGEEDDEDDKEKPAAAAETKK